MLPVRVDPSNQIGQSQMIPPRNLLQSFPERIFEADAGLVAGDDDGFSGRDPQSVSNFDWSDALGRVGTQRGFRTQRGFHG